MDQYLKSDLPNFTSKEGATGEDVAVSVVKRVIGLAKYFIGGVALLLGIIYGMSLIFSMGKEESITKNRKNFIWVFMGFVILMVAENIANIFNPEKATAKDLINFKAANDQLRSIANYVKWMFGSVIVLLSTVSGIRMITAGENEETITKEKRHLVYSGIGMLVVLLASSMVNTIYVVKSPEQIVAGNATQTITEIGGVIRLLLVFLGPVAIIFTIYAGFMYLTALDNEERANKAKRMIVAGVTGVVMVYAAYALVNTFMVADLVSK